jgi:hypothetical protein
VSNCCFYNQIAIHLHDWGALLSRAALGDMLFQRLNAREKLAGSEDMGPAMDFDF